VENKKGEEGKTDQHMSRASHVLCDFKSVCAKKLGNNVRALV